MNKLFIKTALICSMMTFFSCVIFGGTSFQMKDAEITVDGKSGTGEAKIFSDGTVTLQSTGLVSKVELVWKCDLSWVEKTFGGDWERCYGIAGWRKLNPKYPCPWYCLATGSGRTDGFGVEVQPAAFATWKLSTDSVRLILDVRAGRKPVRLGGRKLELCRVVTRKGIKGETPFAAGRALCKMMCPKPRLPKEIVYGYNDWYCAYGKNTAENFFADAEQIVALCEGLPNRPFVVVDDGWQSSDFRGGTIKSELQWSQHNKNWGMPMDQFCKRVKSMGARPGLWYRPFYVNRGTERSGIDPTDPRWAAQIAADMKRFREWGIELVKIDFITYDWSPRWNFRPNDSVLDGVKINWRDDTRTAAEVVRELYKVMRDSAGDGMYIIGCNAIDHFAAGLFELQRIGDDTSGRSWKRTKKMGPNAIAMRAIHNNIFYFNDGDCVGLTKKNAVPWSKNAQWLDLVACSGTSLFVSWRRQFLNDDVKKAFKEAFKRASNPQETGEAIDWMENLTPKRWKFGTEEKTYRW
jgi:alpha-galactosidase